jgi:hypothetical protein
MSKHENRGRGKPENTKNNKFIIIIVLFTISILVLSILLFFFLNNKDTKVIGKPIGGSGVSSNIAGDTKSLRKSVVFNEQPQIADKSEVVEEIKDLPLYLNLSFSDEIESTVSRLPIKSGEGNKVILPLDVVSGSRCGIADLDIIRTDTTQGNLGSNLIVSVEPLQSNNKFPNSGIATHWYEIVKDKLSKPLEIDLASDSAIAGIFICSDKSGTKSCGNKKVLSMIEMSNQLASTTVETYPLEKVDKIYYFAPFLIEKKGIAFLTGDEFEDQTKLFLEGLSATSNDNIDNSTLISKYVEYDKLLTSMRPKSIGGRFVIDLPHLDLALCERK